MKDVLAQWPLAEVIAAKIDRRIALLAELHSIEAELSQAGVMLSELAMVKVASQEAAVARYVRTKTDSCVAEEHGLVAPSAPLTSIRGNRSNHEHARRLARAKNDSRLCACGAAFSVHKLSQRVDCDTCLRARRVAHIRHVHAKRTAQATAA